MLKSYRGKGTEIVIPEGVTHIAEHAFDSRSTLVSVKLPSTLENIGLWAFYHCSSLKHVEI